MPDPNERPAGPDRGSTTGPTTSWPLTQEPMPPGNDLPTTELNQAGGPQPPAPGSRRPSAAPSRPAADSARSRRARQPWAESAGKRLDVIARIACLSAGLALLVAAIVALFVDADNAALIPVLAAGFLLVLTPAVVDRLRSRKSGYYEVHLVGQIAANARKTAEALRRLGMDHELDAYATIYSELRGAELVVVRGEVLDRIVQRVANASMIEKFDKDEVKELFLHGSPIVRVLALGLMEGDLSLIDSSVLLDAIDRSLTGNEQYHALKLVRNGWGRLSPDERGRLMSVIDANPQIQRGPSRGALAQQIRELAQNSRIR
jgi:hypothetical protein